MYSNFENLPEEKKKTILDACMEEFAENGYEKASTNAIIKKAGISKGILFHYFKSKKNLYLYIIDHVFSSFVKDFHKMDVHQSSDLFERFIDWGLKKLKLSHEHPHMTKILMEAFADIPDELKAELMERHGKAYQENIGSFLQGIDMSKFKEDIDKNKAIEVVLMLVEAIGNKYLKIYQGRTEAMLEDMDQIMAQYQEYFGILKGGIYRREEVEK